jgi:hypothetical protein
MCRGHVAWVCRGHVAWMCRGHVAWVCRGHVAWMCRGHVAWVCRGHVAWSRRAACRPSDALLHEGDQDVSCAVHVRVPRQLFVSTAALLRQQSAVPPCSVRAPRPCSAASTAPELAYRPAGCSTVVQRPLVPGARIPARRRLVPLDRLAILSLGQTRTHGIRTPSPKAQTDEIRVTAGSGGGACGAGARPRSQCGRGALARTRRAAAARAGDSSRRGARCCTARLAPARRALLHASSTARLRATEPWVCRAGCAAPGAPTWLPAARRTPLPSPCAATGHAFTPSGLTGSQGEPPELSSRWPRSRYLLELAALCSESLLSALLSALRFAPLSALWMEC